MRINEIGIKRANQNFAVTLVERCDARALVGRNNLIAGLKFVIQEIRVHLKIFIVVTKAFNRVHLINQLL